MFPLSRSGGLASGSGSVEEQTGGVVVSLVWCRVFVRPLFSIRSSWVRNVSPEHVLGDSRCRMLAVVARMVRVLLLVSVLRRGRL